MEVNWLGNVLRLMDPDRLWTRWTGKYNRPIPFSLPQGIAPELLRTREVRRTAHDHARGDKDHKLLKVLRYFDSLEQPTQHRDFFQKRDTTLGFVPGILHDSPYDHRIPVSDQDIGDGLSTELIRDGIA